VTRERLRAEMDIVRAAYFRAHDAIQAIAAPTPACLDAWLERETMGFYYGFMLQMCGRF
jgi:hypothetical protein